MANTRETMGEAACLDALIADTLTNFEDDAVTKVGEGRMYYRDSLVSVKLPACTTIQPYGFSGCTSLETVDILGKLESPINNNAFSGCTSLTSLIFRCRLPNSTSNMVFYDSNLTGLLSNTPIIQDLGAIYVPDADYRQHMKASDSVTSLFTLLPISRYPASDFSTITDSWSTISQKCSNGDYANDYAVGDTKSITIDGNTYLMHLVAMDTDVLASDGTTTVPTTWLMGKQLYAVEQKMNTTTGSTRSWAASELRAWLSGTLMPLLPAELQSAIKEVRKYSGKYENGAVVKDDITADKLWIPSQQEMQGSTTYETLGNRYPPHVSGTSMAKCTVQRTRYIGANRRGWWLRTCTSATAFATYSSSGSASSGMDTTVNGVCFGFCI